MDVTVVDYNGISYYNCPRVVTIGNTEGVTYSIDDDYWAVPHQRSGMISGLTYKLKSAYPSAPTPDSFSVTRVWDRTKGTGHYMYVVGTSTQFRTAAGGGAATPVASTIPIGVPVYGNNCWEVADTNGNYIIAWPIPAKTGGQTYTVASIVDGVMFTGTALASAAAIVTYLTTNQSAAGTWSVNGAGNLQVSSTAQHSVGVTIKVV